MVNALPIVNLVLLLIVIGFLVAYLILGIKAWNYVNEVIDTKIKGTVNQVNQVMRNLQI
jgi:hypothetical protein